MDVSGRQKDRIAPSSMAWQFSKLLFLVAFLYFNAPNLKFSNRISLGFFVEEHARSVSPNHTTEVWSENDIVSYMESNPSRAFFSRLFRDGGFRTGIEVGTANGRYSEHFLRDLIGLANWSWTIVEPFPNAVFKKNLLQDWQAAGLLEMVNLTFLANSSLDTGLLEKLPPAHYDFIYLDGDHSYEGVKAEIPLYWDKIKSGGVLAGHDYCNHGEMSLSCRGCAKVPRCQKYTDYGIRNGKPRGRIAANQHGVVMAVQEWLTEINDTSLVLHHTTENFTRESLLKEGMDYDLVITNTRNPSWFIAKI